jgi:hypothetical protein
MAACLKLIRTTINELGEAILREQTFHVDRLSPKTKPARRRPKKKV